MNIVMNVQDGKRLAERLKKSMLVENQGERVTCMDLKEQGDVN